MSRAASWKLADVLDFEALLAADEAVAGETLRARDRRIFDEVIRPTLPAEALRDRRVVLRRWLEERRRGSEGLPGDVFNTGSRLLRVVALIAGLLSGAGVAAGVLQYPGQEPVNVSVFLGATLGPQIVIPALLALFWFLAGIQPVRAALTSIACWLGASARKLPGEQRARLQVLTARFGREKELFGELASWPLLITTQIFTVAFNVGVIAALLAHVPTHELRFGWQTTLELESQTAVKIVETIALPWSWAPSPHPTAEQIAATRYAPGQAHASLPGEAARAWWPFLLYAIACYGLIVRLMVLGFAAIQLQRELALLRFDHAPAGVLWRRLSGPLVLVDGNSAKLVIPDHAPHERAAASGECVLLLAAELAEGKSAVEQQVENVLGWQIKAAHMAKVDSRRESGDLFAEVKAVAGGLASVVVAVPATRDPIVAIALFLRELIAAAQGGPEVVLLLTGAPRPEGIEAPSEERLKYWRDFIAIHRLDLAVETWKPA